MDEAMRCSACGRTFQVSAADKQAAVTELVGQGQQVTNLSVYDVVCDGCGKAMLDFCPLLTELDPKKRGN
jgi:hypothetical protein